MYWGDEYVPIRQARRALMTWLGDARASRQRARDAARAILGQIGSPQATPRARRELLDVLAEAAWTGRPDFARMERAIRAVFEPDHTQIRRAIGYPAAPMMTDSMIDVMKARLTAATELMAGRVTDDALIQAREAHLFAYAEYAAQQPFLAAAVHEVGLDGGRVAGHVEDRIHRRVHESAWRGLRGFDGVVRGPPAQLGRVRPCYR